MRAQSPVRADKNSKEGVKGFPFLTPLGRFYHQLVDFLHQRGETLAKSEPDGMTKLIFIGSGLSLRKTTGLSKASAILSPCCFSLCRVQCVTQIINLNTEHSAPCCEQRHQV